MFWNVFLPSFFFLCSFLLSISTPNPFPTAKNDPSLIPSVVSPCRECGPEGIKRFYSQRRSGRAVVTGVFPSPGSCLFIYSARRVQHAHSSAFHARRFGSNFVDFVYSRSPVFGLSICKI